MKTDLLVFLKMTKRIAPMETLNPFLMIIQNF